MYLKNSLFIVLIIALSNNLLAQNGVIKGFVTNQINNEPIPFVSVYIDSVQNGTTTDKNGFYKFGLYPRWSVQLHRDNLAAVVAEQPSLGSVPSYQSVRRRMVEKGWIRRAEPAKPTEGQSRAARRRESREIRSFEASHVHALWHLDFHQARLKILDSAGRWHTPVALAILDDRSRLCCHLQFYLAETAENLVHGLTQAFLKRGLPRALLTDNGAAMLAEETRQGLARLGIEQKNTLPYSAYQNGKQEVLWAQLEGRLRPRTDSSNAGWNSPSLNLDKFILPNSVPYSFAIFSANSKLWEHANTFGSKTVFSIL